MIFSVVSCLFLIFQISNTKKLFRIRTSWKTPRRNNLRGISVFQANSQTVLKQRAQNGQNLKAFAVMIQRRMGPEISSPLVIYSTSVEFRPLLLNGAKHRKEHGSGKLPWGGNWNEAEMAALPPPSEQVAACGSCSVTICWMLVL